MVKCRSRREDQIRKLSRESQKITDLNNSLIRKGMAKSQKGFNFNAALKNLENRLSTPDFSTRNYTDIERTTSGTLPLT